MAVLNPQWDPANDVFCLGLPDIPDKLEICLPGGFCLSHIWQTIDKIPHGADMPLQFFGQIGPAMGALQPVFTILDTVIAIFRCVTAIPKAILQLNPQELFDCLPELVELINKLLSMIPQMSIPRMVKQAIIAIAMLLEGVASDFDFLLSQLQRVLDEIDRAADLNDVQLNNFLTCRQNTINDQALSTSEALQGIGRIILLVNIMIGMFGGDVEVPCFSDSIDLTDLEVLIELLLTLAEYLRQIAALIPDPQFAITVLLGDTRC